MCERAASCQGASLRTLAVLSHRQRQPFSGGMRPGTAPAHVRAWPCARCSGVGTPAGCGAQPRCGGSSGRPRARPASGCGPRATACAALLPAASGTRCGPSWPPRTPPSSLPARSAGHPTQLWRDRLSAHLVGRLGGSHGEKRTVVRLLEPRELRRDVLEAVPQVVLAGQRGGQPLVGVLPAVERLGVQLSSSPRRFRTRLRSLVSALPPPRCTNERRAATRPAPSRRA